MTSNKSITECMKACREAFEEAGAIKDSARRDKKNYNLFKDAMEKYKKAADLANFLSGALVDMELRLQYDALNNYYMSEYYICSMLDYNKEDIYSLNNAIDMCQKAHDSLKKAVEIIDEIENSPFKIQNRNAWFFSKNDQAANIFNLKAEIETVNEKYIDAADNYKRAERLSEENMEFCESLCEKGEIEEVFLRCAKGNFYATIGNYHAMRLAHFSQQNDVQKLIIELSATIKAGQDAYDHNPEWTRYVNTCEHYSNWLNSLLEEHRNIWGILISKKDAILEEYMEKLDKDYFSKKRNEVTRAMTTNNNFFAPVGVVGDNANINNLIQTNTGNNVALNGALDEFDKILEALVRSDNLDEKEKHIACLNEFKNAFAEKNMPKQKECEKNWRNIINVKNATILLGIVADTLTVASPVYDLLNKIIKSTM